MNLWEKVRERERERDREDAVAELHKNGETSQQTGVNIILQDILSQTLDFADVINGSIPISKQAVWVVLEPAAGCLRRQEHPCHMSRYHREKWHLPHRTSNRIRHQNGWWCDTKEGWC